MNVSDLYNKFLFCLCTRCYLRKVFKFLVDLNYKETIDEKLILQEWRDGISYSNGKKVVVFTFDKREKSFVTIFYEIQKGYCIPKPDRYKFFTLDEFLTKEQKIQLLEVCNFD